MEAAGELSVPVSIGEGRALEIWFLVICAPSTLYGSLVSLSDLEIGGL